MRSLQEPKVFCIGWHKTGTTSMGEALLLLGYKVVGARLDMADPLLKGEQQLVLDEARKYDAFQDVPWAALYRELDKAFPKSKFILTVRDENKWLISARRHFGDLDIKLHEWLYGVGCLVGNEEVYMARYRRHNREVLEYFAERKDDILIMTLEDSDGWEKLCPFLNKPVPLKRFPFANKGSQRLTSVEKVYIFFRDMIPPIIRLYILRLLGKSDTRNRFHNAGNSSYIEQLKRANKK